MNSKSFLEVEMPPAIARLPKDARGYPVPYSALYVNGKPDFTQVDPSRWVRLFKIKGCGVCGSPITGRLFFVGGPMCATNRLFFDHPMHEDCAVYALRVCPFLALPKMAYRKREDEGVEVLASVSDRKPEIFMMGKARAYDVTMNGSEPLLYAAPWESLRWWRAGVEIAEEEAKQWLAQTTR